jgi:hypothetical protein
MSQPELAKKKSKNGTSVLGTKIQSTIQTTLDKKYLVKPKPVRKNQSDALHA